MKSRIQVVVALAIIGGMFGTSQAVLLNDDAGITFGKNAPLLVPRLPVEIPQVGPGPVCPPSGCGGSQQP